MREKILSVKDLKVHFAINDNKKFFAKKIVKAVDGISFDVCKGETLGLVGESGCGKSTTGRAIVALQKPTAGSILYHGKDITTQTKAERFSYKSQVQMIFQDTYSTLDPRFTIGSSIVEPLEIHRRGTRAEQKETALKLMHDVGLAESYYNRYPHEFMFEVSNNTPSNVKYSLVPLELRWKSSFSLFFRNLRPLYIIEKEKAETTKH